MNNKKVFEFITNSLLLVRAFFWAAFLRTRLLKGCFSALFVLQLAEAHNLQLSRHTFGVLRQLRVNAEVFLRDLLSGRLRYGCLRIYCRAVKFRRGPLSSASFTFSERSLSAFLLLPCDQIFGLAISSIFRPAEFLGLRSHRLQLQLSLLLLEAFFEGSIDCLAFFGRSNRSTDWNFDFTGRCGL